MFDDDRIHVHLNWDFDTDSGQVTVSHKIASVTVPYGDDSEDLAMDALDRIVPDRENYSLEYRMNAKILSGLIENAMVNR